MDNYWWQHQVKSPREFNVLDSQVWIGNTYRRVRRTHRGIERHSRAGIILAIINVKVVFLSFNAENSRNWETDKMLRCHFSVDDEICLRRTRHSEVRRSTTISIGHSIWYPVASNIPHHLVRVVAVWSWQACGEGTMVEEDTYMAAPAVYVGIFWLDGIERARVTNTRSQDPTTVHRLAQLPKPLLYVAWAERNPYGMVMNVLVQTSKGSAYHL